MENKLKETACNEIVEKPEKAKKDRKTPCATPEMIEKLEILIKENGCSQKEFVEHIIKLMEVDNAKQRLSAREPIALLCPFSPLGHYSATPRIK